MACSKGLVKQKEYDWKDSNLALFGSDLDKNVKKEAALTERAWQGAGLRPGLKIWRIENFKVKAWPRADYGTFYDGDSYIILNTYKNEDTDELKYDVHFWIGEHSTQDEYGTAAYKTVELDTYLDDKAVQHREVMKHESRLFQSYFTCLTTLEGGVKSGFKNVLPTDYNRRLLRIHGTTMRNCKVEEVPLSKSSLNNEDVFILDLGLTIYQYNGRECDKDEKFRATQVCQQIKSERGGKVRIETLDESEMERTHVFYKMCGDKVVQKGEKGDYDEYPPTLLRYSVSNKGVQLREVEKGKLHVRTLVSDDVFLLDTGNELFIWVGSKASIDEKRTSLEKGHNYLKQTSHPMAAISIFCEGDEPQDFKDAFVDFGSK